MSSDLQQLMRAVKIIAKLAWKYRPEDVAAALLKHCSQRERKDVPFVGQYLVDVWELYKGPESGAEPRCCECGGSIYVKKDGNRQIAEILGVSRGTIERDTGQKYSAIRADTRYCSQACRQRAYRKRVMASPSGSSRKRHAVTSS